MPRGVLNPLEAELAAYILENGPVDVATFMQWALSHPVYGYYRQGDPLGARGDFTTAPEISQMFGEMIGIWAADLWQKMGQPSVFTLLECGPGRGTLMADALRGVAHVPGFIQAARVHLLEINATLKAQQAQVLSAYAPSWITDIQQIPTAQPVIVIANEFLDALPSQQYVEDGDQSVLRRVDYSLEEGFFWQPRFYPGQRIREDSPARNGWVRDLAARIVRQGGGALLIDYGYGKPGYGDTLQALARHGYVDVLQNIGAQDITTHVDFSAVAQASKQAKAAIFGPVGQGEFLRRMGISLRAAQLSAIARDPLAIQQALHRLIDSDEMGVLFTVLGLTHGTDCIPAGFTD